jgi:tetratricopeptide (TPR) repeat protein
MIPGIADRWNRIRSRLDLETLGRIAQSAVAAAIAWEIALQIPSSSPPFFAPIAAVIGLAADRGRRGRQAIDMIIGVALGILIGAALVEVGGAGAWQLGIGTLVALVLTTAAGVRPIIRTQAAASTILVVALHVPGSNLAWTRLVDALIGGGIAIVLARFLFPVDPFDLVRDEAAELRERLAQALDAGAKAIETRDRDEAERVLARLDEIDDGRLEDALALAREVVRAAPRRRPLRRRLDALGRAWGELDRSVADGRAIGTGVVRLVSRDGPPPPAAARAIEAAAAAVRAVDPAEARKRADAARDAARRLLAEDDSIATNVIAHGVASVADHARSAADARDEERRLREQAHRPRIRVPHPNVSRWHGGKRI